MTTIITKNSSTASAAPVAGDLTKGELAVNVTDKKLYTKDNGGSVVKLVGSLGNQEANAVAITGGAIDGTPIGGTTASTASFTTVSASGNVTLSGGTANGVAYLNGSKVVTSGSALTFDGAGTVTINGGSSANGNLRLIRTGSYPGDFSVVAGGQSSTTNFLIYDNTNSQNAYLYLGGASGYSAWYQNGSEVARLTSTGLGIGTSSPQTKLAVETSGNQSVVSPVITGQSSGVTYGGMYTVRDGAGDQRGLVWQTYTDNIGLTEKLRLDSSGNLGLGVTPSAWGTYKAFQTARAGLMGAGNDLNLSVNGYYDGANWRYIATASAALYNQSGAAHSWHTAASGTAGNAITFTQAATLTADGDYLVGQTSAGLTDAKSVTLSKQYGVVYVNHLTGQTSGDQYAIFGYAGGSIGSITQNGTTAVAYNTSSDYRLKNITGPLTNSGAYIDSLNPVEGTWKADGSVFVGLIAHEVQEASRTHVATGVKDGEEMQGMDYSSSEIIANLIAEVKSLRQRVATLEAQ